MDFKPLEVANRLKFNYIGSTISIFLRQLFEILGDVVA